MLTGVVVMATAAALKGYVHIDLGRNATIVIELAVGLAVGMAAQTAARPRRAGAGGPAVRVTGGPRTAVPSGARRRDQVLALVSRRGREIGGKTAELAELAGNRNARCGAWSARPTPTPPAQ